MCSPAATQHVPHSNSLCDSTWFIFSIALYINPISISFHCNSFLKDKERKGGKSAEHQETDWARRPWAPWSMSSPWGRPKSLYKVPGAPTCTCLLPTTPHFSAVKANDLQVYVIHLSTSHGCIGAVLIPSSLCKDCNGIEFCYCYC